MNSTVSPTVAEALVIGVTVQPMDADERILSVHDYNYPRSRAWQLTPIEWLDMTRAVDAAFEFLANPWNTEADTTNVLAFAYDASMFCADHGKTLPHGGDGDEYASPVFEPSELNAVEWCDNGHSFCGNCGTDLEGKGSQDADLKDHFARCWNCANESVYVDGEGYVGVYRWADALDTLKVQVYGPTVTYVTDSRTGYTRVDTIIDESGTNVRTLRAYLAFRDLAPSADTTLILVNGRTADECWSEADDYAVDHFVDQAGDTLDQDDDADMSDFRASVQVVEVPTDQVWFTTK